MLLSHHWHLAGIENHGGPESLCLCYANMRSEVLEQFLQDLDQKERREGLYGATAVHASFGDVEQAQMTLRGIYAAHLFGNTA